jgi:WD40 repeat protein
MVLVSPDYKSLLIETADHKLHLYLLTTNVSLEVFLQLILKIYSSETNHLRFMKYLRVTDSIVCASESSVSFWDPKSWLVFGKFTVNGQITSIDTSPVLGLVAVGTSLGYVRLFTADSFKNVAPQLIFKHRTHSKSVLNVIGSI